MKIKTITHEKCSQLAISLSKSPSRIIRFKPHVLNNVGIGWVDEGEATSNHFKKFPVVLDPWIRKEGLNP